MIRKSLLVLIPVFIFQYSWSQKVEYVLSMSKPHTHYFEVEINVRDFKKEVADFKMPVWAPGSYLVREFAKNVDMVTANAGNDKLKIEKTDKNTWKVMNGKKTDFTLKYRVYAYETSVRTSFLDDSHAFISGTSVFMYLDGAKLLPGKLVIKPHESFKKISTSLTKESDKVYSYPDIDVLYDCPIEIGNQDVFYFDAAGVKHEVCMYGEGNYVKEKLQKDMARIVEEATKVYGVNPNKHYVFIIHNLTVGSGGLEHASSTTLDVNRHTYSPAAYNGFLSLVAHEYFHLWNVKRIRPIALGPFDYTKENYTNMLWVAEGFTSYYDELLLKRAGYYDENQYIRALTSTIASVENQPGSKVQSVAESSFDAWIKGYRPNENSYNTTISYYPKGAIIAALLDIEIIVGTKGEKKLDDLLKYLYNEYYMVKKRGYTDKEFKEATEKIAGKKMDDFFAKYIYGVEAIDYNSILSKVGVNLFVSPRSNEPSLGIQTKDSGGKLVITGITAGSTAYEQGLNVNDEIIAVNNLRVDNNTLGKIFQLYDIDDNISVMIARDNVIKIYTLKVKGNVSSDYVLKPLQGEEPGAGAYYSKWLN